jgi:hypothetical protein
VQADVTNAGSAERGNLSEQGCVHQNAVRVDRGARIQPPSVGNAGAVLPGDGLDQPGQLLREADARRRLRVEGDEELTGPRRPAGAAAERRRGDASSGP